MTYPSQAELLSADPLADFIDRHFLRADPFAFQGLLFGDVVAQVAALLDVDANGIFCIGSGAVGLSVNPDKVADSQLKAFDAGSDLDLAVISEVHFEAAWRDLRRAVQPTLSEIDALVAENLNWQKKKFFDGAILAHKLLPALSFGNTWIASLVQISESIAVMLEREIELHVWIYRDYWSLRNYVSAGIVKCRERVI